MIEQHGVRAGLAGGGLFVATAVLVAIQLPLVPFVMVLVVGVAFASTTVAGAHALLIAVTGWALATGFGVNALGQLTFMPADLVRLGLFVAIALFLRGERDGMR